MRLFTIMALTCALAWPCQGLAGQAAPREADPMSRTRMSLEQRVGGEVYQRAGLHKLSPEEQWVLSDWIGQYTRDITAYVERQCRRQAGEKPKP